MNWRISIVFSILLLFFACQNNDSISIQNYVIELEEFENISSKPNIKLIDFRKPELYKKDHISGAINIWRSDIENPTYSYGGMMPSKEQLERQMSVLLPTKSPDKEYSQ